MGPGDEHTRFLCERLLATASPGDRARWSRSPGRSWWIGSSSSSGARAPGWELVGHRAGYAGDWDEALHLALMVEQPDYPYGEPREARAVRERSG